MAHLTIEERQKIEELLKSNTNFTNIGKELNKHRTTIKDEIIKNSTTIKSNNYGTNIIRCSLSNDCTNFHGKYCTKKCDNFIQAKCELLSKPPYVCNSCNKKHRCRLEKVYYRYLEANKIYLNLLSSSRKGLRITKNEIDTVNKEIAPLIIDKNHSVNQIYINNPDKITFSKSSFYNFTNAGLFDFKNIDLTRKVRYKPRNKARRTREESKIRLNRTYKDYQEYIELIKDNNVSIVQMDTVEGFKGEKCFLTLLFVEYNLMLTYLIKSQTKEEVNNIFNELKLTLGEEEFSRLFQIILTDNGKEFYGVDDITTSLDKKRTLIKLFYCDPSASYQKGDIEKNHEFIREYLPKKSSFNNLNQKVVTLMNNHINSIPRESLKNKTPYQSSINFITSSSMEILHLKRIEPNDVIRNKNLLNIDDF